MARKRAYKKRADYRKGGRVQYQFGGQTDQTRQLAAGAIDPNDPDFNPDANIDPTTGLPPSSVAAGGGGATGGGGAIGGGGATVDPNAKAKADARAKFDAISATGNYTDQQTQNVQDAIAIGAITTDEAATKFGVRPDQITQEIVRRKAVQAGKDIDAPVVTLPVELPGYGSDFTPPYYDPYQGSPVADPNTGQFKVDPVTGRPVTDPYKFRDMEAEKQAEAKKAADLAAQSAAVSKIPADGKYTPAEAQQVVTALNSGAITSAQAAQIFGSTVAQVEAELKRQNEVADTGTTDILDPFAGGVQAATRPELLKRAQKAQMDAVDVKTKADGTTAPGAFVSDYQRVDPNLLFDDRKTETLDPSVGITPDTAIKQVSDYSDITAPTGVDDNTFTEAQGVVDAAIKAGTITASGYTAELAKVLNSPQFATNINRTPITAEELEGLSERTTAAQMSAAEKQAGQAQRITDDFISDASSVGAVDFRKAVNISPTSEAEKQSREAITGTKATSDAAKITDTIGYEAYQRREVTGTAASEAAITFTAETADLPPNLARTLVEDPATVTAQIDSQAPEVVFAAAALPTEALVSSQMETLLAGIESGTVPAWAKPAYDSVNQNMAQRGIDASTVGRDALFNAIIQSAIPIAQSNAQALQARAAQNLSNEQQGKLQQAQLDSTRRMNNLANRQSAESQTAQFAQNLNVLQSQFNQERDTLSAQQQQQTRVQNLQNQQRTAELNAQNAAAARAQNLGNEQQMELANLEIKNQTEQQNMTVQNQERLAEFQVAADFISKNAAFDQQMKTANLSNDQQMRLANLTAMNQADSESLSNAQQTELANLNTRMQTNIAQGRIAETMGVALLNADQQRAVQNAATIARMDLTKFSDAQQVELANSKFMQTASLADFNARQQAVMQDATALAGLDMATVDQRTKLAITQAQNFLSRDMANLSNEQQSLILSAQSEQQKLLSDQAATNAARQFNATSDNQINQFVTSLAAQVDQFNATQANAMEQFNTSEENRVAAMNANNAIDVAKFNNQLQVQIDSFNEQYDLQREQWNAANAQAIEQSNITWRRNANTIDTAATNATNQENAAKAFQISAADQNFIWQELRDEAAYLRQAFENDEQRTTTLYATAISNDVGGKGADGISPIIDLIKNKVGV
mgnify:CR=1 FL=1